MHPVLFARDCSFRQPLSVSVSSLTRHDRLCNPSWASSRALARASRVPVPLMPLLRFGCPPAQPQLLGAALFCLVDAPAGLPASALKCGPLSNCLIAPRVGQVCQLLPARVPLLSSSLTHSFGVPQLLLVSPTLSCRRLRPAWQRALSIGALCQIA